MTPEPTDCHDCNATPGQVHGSGCDVERCTVCKGQRLLCDCAGHDRKAARWTGEWPGSAECRERGWYARFTNNGWQPCAADDPGALPDLNRWVIAEMSGADTLYSERN